MNMRYILIILMLITCFVGCNISKDNPADKPDPNFNKNSILGEWKIVPSHNKKIVFQPDGRILLNEDGNISNLYLKIDSAGARIQTNREATTPIGYFLFSEKKEDSWHGVWDHDIVRLVKLSNSSGSILE